MSSDHLSADDANSTDGEGVWSPEIEQAFQEALLLFPPCGRRKHILQEEGGGKMYGRNELIARHIKMRTGKARTRKQVSSHIQVLARRKAKAEASSSSFGMTPSPTPNTVQSGLESGLQSEQPQITRCYDEWADRPVVTMKIRLVQFSAFIERRGRPTNIQTNDSDSFLCSNQITHQEQESQIPIHQQPISPSIVGFTSPHHAFPLSSNHHFIGQYNQAHNHNLPIKSQSQAAVTQFVPNNNAGQPSSVTLSHPNGDANFFRHSYVKIDYSFPQARETASRFLETINVNQIIDKFPGLAGSEGLFQRGPSDSFFLVKFWADVNNDFEFDVDDQNSFFGFSSHFETIEPYRDITCSTKACSYGLQVVEKVEKIYGTFNNSNSRYSFDIQRSPMCEFMVQFIRKLRQLPRIAQMNSVLENFTVLQVITSESTSEILLCLAYVFEVAPRDSVDGSRSHIYKLTKD